MAEPLELQEAPFMLEGLPGPSLLGGKLTGLDRVLLSGGSGLVRKPLDQVIDAIQEPTASDAAKLQEVRALAADDEFRMRPGARR